MAKKTENKFILGVKFLKAEVSVQTVISREAGKEGKMTAELDFERKCLKIDLCSYGTMSIENTKLLGEALIALSKEAEGLMNNVE